MVWNSCHKRYVSLSSVKWLFSFWANSLFAFLIPWDRFLCAGLYREGGCFYLVYIVFDVCVHQVQCVLSPGCKIQMLVEIRQNRFETGWNPRLPWRKRQDAASAAHWCCCRVLSWLPSHPRSVVDRQLLWRQLWAPSASRRVGISQSLALCGVSSECKPPQHSGTMNCWCHI